MQLGRHTKRIGSLAAALVAVLGFLVLGAPPAAASSPGAPTAVAPSGAVTGSTFTFTWAKASFDPSWYVIEVVDATSATKFNRWYTAAQAGCADVEITCAVTVSLGGMAPGVGAWWVRGWNSEGYGPWSVGMEFTVSVPTPAWAATIRPGWRFSLVMGGAAVLDQETGLVWEQNPDTSFSVAWIQTAQYCLTRSTGGRYGWRAPTAEELMSLLNPTTKTLPAGHPFGANTSNLFWSATTWQTFTDQAWAVEFTGQPTPAFTAKTSTLRLWCVRGGQAQGFGG